MRVRLSSVESTRLFGASPRQDVAELTAREVSPSFDDRLERVVTKAIKTAEDECICPVKLVPYLLHRSMLSPAEAQNRIRAAFLSHDTFQNWQACAAIVQAAKLSMRGLLRRDSRMEQLLSKSILLRTQQQIILIVNSTCDLLDAVGGKVSRGFIGDLIDVMPQDMAVPAVKPIVAPIFDRHSRRGCSRWEGSIEEGRIGGSRIGGSQIGNRTETKPPRFVDAAL